MIFHYNFKCLLSFWKINISDKWAATWQTQQNGCAPTNTQISLGVRPVWSESSLSAWRNLGPLTTHWAHSEDYDQTGRMPRLIWVFAGRTLSFSKSVLFKFLFDPNWRCAKLMVIFNFRMDRLLYTESRPEKVHISKLPIEPGSDKGTLMVYKSKLWYLDKMKELALINISWKFEEIIFINLVTNIWVLELVYIMRF